MESAVADWFKDWGNVRQQHSTSLPPAGKAMGMDIKPDGIYVKALIVEPVAKELVKAGVYQAFSVGISNPKIIRDMDAPGGRVTGGVMSELSIVDRPANSACRFSLAKRAKDGTVVDSNEMYVGNTVVPIPERASLVKGAIAMMLKMDTINKDVTISDNNTQETNGMNKGAKSTTAGEEPAPLPAEPGDASVSGNVGDDRIMKADELDKAGAVSPPSAPGTADNADGQGAPPPVEDTRSDVGGPQPPVAVAKDFGDDSDDDDDDSDGSDDDDDDSVDKGVGAFDGPPEVTGKKVKKGKKGKQGQVPPDGLDTSVHVDPVLDDDADIDASSEMGKSFPPAVKRLHDACCVAYSDSSILKEYGDTPAEIIRSTGQEVMFTALRNAVAADMGKGIHVAAITDLTDAYSTASLVALASPSTIKEVRNELHKSFVSENSDCLADEGKLPSPKDAGQPTAGKYKRPLITSGQSKANASGGGDSGARIPSSGDTPKGSDFTRGPVTAGQERPSPGMSKSASRIGPAGSGASTYFGNAAKDQAANAMTALHDHLSYTFPDMCPMGPDSGISNTPVSNASGSAVTGVASQSQGPKSVPDSKVTGAASNAVVNKVFTGETSEEDDVENNKLLKKNAKLKKQIAKMQKQLVAYGAEPDPFRAPVRGVMVGDVYDTSLGSLRKSEIEEYAEMLSLSSNPDYRLRAQDVLNKLGK